MSLKSIIITILLFILPRPVLCEEVQHVYNFGGVNSQDDSLFIDEKDATYAVNVLTDEGDLRTIYGNTLFTSVGSSTVSFRREFLNPDNERYNFAVSGTALYSSSSTAFSLIRNWNSTPELDMVAAFGKAYFVDGSTSPFYSTGSSVTVISNMEDFKYVELYQTRLVGVNTTTETSKVYLSAYNAPTSWGVTTSKDSAAIKYFRKDDGEGVNCVYSTPEGIFIGKLSSCGMLKGSDNETFYWKEISDKVGCVDDNLVQIVDGLLVWLSNDGYYSYDFNRHPAPISREITPQTNLIKQSGSVDKAWTVNTKALWEAGTYAGWDTAIFPGKIKAGTYHKKAQELTPMNLIDEGGENGGTTSTTTYIPGGTTGAGHYSSAWTSYGGQTGNTYVWCYADTYTSQGTGVKYGICALLYSGASLNTLSMINAVSSVTIASLSVPAYVGGPAKVYLIDLDTSSNTIVKLKLADSTGNNYILSNGYHGSRGGTIYVTFKDYSTYIDHIEFVAGSTVTSSTYDTQLTTPNYQAITASGTATTHFFTSVDSITWSSALTPPFADTYQKRYWKYDIVFGASAPDYYSDTITAFSTGTYKSEVKAVSTDMSAWKLFSVSYSTDSTAPEDYYVRSGTYAFSATGALPAVIAQTENAIVAASTNPFVQFQIGPDIQTATDTLIVNSISMAYVIGSAAPRGASVVDNHRYIASVAHDSESENDFTYIWQKNKKWVFSDQGYGALGIYNDRPLGSATDITSKLWYIMDEKALSFDGTAINSYWETKNYPLGSLNNHKVINRIWINADGDGVQDFGVAWQANRDGVWHSTTTSLAGSDFIVKEVEGLFETRYLGRQYKFKLSGSELDKYFRLKLFSIYYTVNDLIKD